MLNAVSDCAAVRSVKLLLKRGLALCVAMCCLAAAGCADDDKAKAGALVEEIKRAVETGDNQRAVALCDSLKRAYPQQIEGRREALHLNARAVEALSIRQLEEADMMLASTTLAADSLAKLVRRVENPIGAYFVGKDTKTGDVGKVDGLQARISPEGDLYITSTLASRKGVKSERVSLHSPSGDTASTPGIPCDGELNDRSSGVETILFMGQDCDSLARFVSIHSQEPLTLVFHGASEFRMPLPASQAADIALLYECACTWRSLKVLTLEEERLTRAIDLARSQAARTYQSPGEDGI